MYDYEHTQPGTLVRTLLLTTGLLVCGVLFATGGVAIMILPLVILTIIFFLFHSLTVRVSRNEIAISFGIGIIRTSFAVDELASAKAVKTHWYNGWGIRLIKGGWLYNVSGFDAVEIVLNNGRVYRIGTDEPQALLAAIESAMAPGR